MWETDHWLWLYLQSTLRKMQSLCLVHEYNTDEEVKLLYGILVGLSFLPLAQVEEGLEFLLRNIPNIQSDNWLQCQSTHIERVGFRWYQQYGWKLTAMKRNAINPHWVQSLGVQGEEWNRVNIVIYDESGSGHKIKCYMCGNVILSINNNLWIGIAYLTLTVPVWSYVLALDHCPLCRFEWIP